MQRRGVLVAMASFVVGLGGAAVRADPGDADERSRAPAPVVPLVQQEAWCRNGAFPGEDTEHRLMRVRPGIGEVAIRRDWPDRCPGEGPFLAPDCDSGTRLEDGDEVIAGRTFGTLTCVWFEGPQHESVGYVPSSALRRGDEDAWLGAWSDGPQTLDISRSTDGSLHVRGDAIWIGAVLESGDRVVHVGEVNAPAVFHGNRLLADDGWCTVSMKRVGDALIVHDNRECGGVNVSFDGVYRRPSP